MKTLRVFVLVSTSVLIGMPSYAQDEPRKQFVTLEQLELSAEQRGPDLQQMSASKRARFERLSSLKRSFSSELRQSIAALQ